MEVASMVGINAIGLAIEYILALNRSAYLPFEHFMTPPHTFVTHHALIYGCKAICNKLAAYCTLITTYGSISVTLVEVLENLT